MLPAAAIVILVGSAATLTIRGAASSGLGRLGLRFRDCDYRPVVSRVWMEDRRVFEQTQRDSAVAQASHRGRVAQGRVTTNKTKTPG